MRAVFRQQGFPALFAGVTTSMFGDSVMLLVFSMWVKQLTGSNAMAGLTFFWMVLPALAAPLLGGPIDRVRRKALVVWGNLASAAILLPLLLVRDAGDVWIIWSVAFLYGISFVVLPAGINGLLKEMLPEDRLVEANASIQTVKESFRLIGPVIGATLFVLVGGWAVALIDLGSFLLAAFLISRLRLDEHVEPSTDDWKRNLTVGVGHLVRDPLLRHVLVALGVVILVMGFTEASIYAVLDAFGRPLEFVSYIVTVQGVGAIAGGLLATRMIRRVGESGAIAFALGVLGIALVVVATAPTIWFVFAASIPLGFALAPITVGFMTLVQKRTPQAIMGRVSAATSVVFGVPQAVSLAVGAALVAVLSFRSIFAIMAVVAFGAVVYLVVTVRSTFRPEERPQGSPDLSAVDPGAPAAPVLAAPVLAEPAERPLASG